MPSPHSCVLSAEPEAPHHPTAEDSVVASGQADRHRNRSSNCQKPTMVRGQWGWGGEGMEWTNGDGGVRGSGQVWVKSQVRLCCRC